MMKRPFLRTVLRDRGGAIAILVAIAMPALIGAMVFAIDFTNFRITQNRLQAAADAAAIAGVKALDTPGDVATEAIRLARANVPASWGNITIDTDVTIGHYSAAGGFLIGSSPDGNAVRVRAVRTDARGNGVRWLAFNIWGLDNLSLSAEATAARQLNIQYEPPESVDLDNEAGDFNEIYAYCYDRTAGGDRESRRTQMTLISNNLGRHVDVAELSGGYVTEVPASPPVWPKCNQQGQAISLRLRNIRNGKNGTRFFADGTREEYDHFTDTIVTGGVEDFSGLEYTILETVRCDTLDACNPWKAGSDVPRGKNRTPVREDRPCLPGKYMYFGWEDRPPGLGWTDEDYDDITLIMKCPHEGMLGDGITRLVG